MSAPAAADRFATVIGDTRGTERPAHQETFDGSAYYGPRHDDAVWMLEQLDQLGQARKLHTVSEHNKPPKRLRGAAKERRAAWRELYRAMRAVCEPYQEQAFTRILHPALERLSLAVVAYDYLQPEDRRELFSSWHGAPPPSWR